MKKMMKVVAALAAMVMALSLSACSSNDDDEWSTGRNVEMPKKTYTVKFVDEDGIVYDTQKVTQGETANEPGGPVKDGYEFLGWYTDDNNYPSVSSYSIWKDTTFTAKWKKLASLDESTSGTPSQSGGNQSEGTGASLPDYLEFSDGGKTVTGYISDKLPENGIITIPDGVTTIGSGAFKSCNDLKGIRISNSVKRIEGGAFEYCNGLTSVTIPYGVTYIGIMAFFQCRNLTTVTFTDGYGWSKGFSGTSIDVSDGNTNAKKLSGQSITDRWDGVSLIKK